MAREQVAERILFSDEEKRAALEKSNNQCCHCGKTLSVKDATIEHFIPLSRGGTNIPTNLVTLCVKCNKEKSNYIYKPWDYYRYLKKEHMANLKVLYECYNQDKSWLTPKNYVKEDGVEIRYPMIIPSMQGHLKKGPKNMLCVKELFASAILRKAKYDDLDSIMSFLQKYHEKYGLEVDYLKEVMSEVFSRGAFYMLFKQNELIAVLPIVTTAIDVNGVKGYVPVLKGFPCINLNKSNVQIIERTLVYIFGTIADINPKSNCFIEVHAPVKDKVLHDLLDKICILYSFDDDDWKSFLIDVKLTDEGFMACRSVKDNKCGKELKASSDFLQKVMKLKPIAEESLLSSEKKKLKKRRRCDFEEFDLKEAE